MSILRRLVTIGVLAVFLFPIIFGIEQVDAGVVQRSAVQVSGGASNTSITINKPAGTVQNDVMVAVITLAVNDTVTAPAGWNLVTSGGNGTVLTLATFYKAAGSSEPSNYTFTWTTSALSAGGIVTYYGVDTANVIDVTGTNATGSSTNVTASAVTTVKSGAMLIGAFGISSSLQSSFTPPSGMTERVDQTSDLGLTSPVTVSLTELIFTPAGSTGNRTAVSAQSGSWSAYLFALKPAPPAVEQSGFRFIGNFDAKDPRTIVQNHTANDDAMTESVMDTVNGFVYTAGHSTTWIIEKRRMRDGALETSFGTSGVLTVNISGSTQSSIGGMVIDLNEGALYIAGDENSLGAGNSQWRIEKRNMLTGALISGFGSGGVLSTNPSAGNDAINDLLIDTTTGYLIAGGYDSLQGNGWWIEKRSISTGALDTNFDGDGIIVYNPSGRPEMVSAMAIDEGGGYFYVTGVDDGAGNTRWRVEKRKISNGQLCTAAECGTLFGTGGAYVDNPTNGADQPLTIQVDVAGNAVYFGGYDNNNGRQWRIVKVNALTAAPITAFGASGVVTFDPSTFGTAEVRQLDLDGKGGYLYVIGTSDRATTNGAAGADMAWFIQKRQRSDGSLVSTWGSSGSLLINPSANIDDPTEVMIDVDRNILYAVGTDRTLGTANSRWRYELFQLDTGDRWYAAQDTLSIASTKVTFRLRMLLHVSNNNLTVAEGQLFKLQSAFKVGTCDTGFIGEEWADVSTSSGDIRFHDNPSTVDGESIQPVPGDPVHSGHTVIMQSMEESNTFTASSDIAANQDGMWDFVLRDEGAFGAYCFRVVNGDGTPLSNYSVLPEVSFCRDDPRAENVMRHGTFFCEGLKRNFFWAQ